VSAGRAAVVLSVALVLAAETAFASAEPRPTKAQIEAQTRAAVAHSRARIVKLQVIPPNRKYALRVQVRDPAAYLRYRVDPLVRLMNRLTRVERNFQRWYFLVLDKRGNEVFWVQRILVANGERWSWNVRPDLAACARNLDLDIEIDPEHAAPPCPR
jgi:hypothetical protein